uniref:protein ITPRID2-like isoform X1 n=2 Tax=Myxine glutinosa TaxID=7769 RepID=UPI00358DE6C3
MADTEQNLCGTVSLSPRNAKHRRAAFASTRCHAARCSISQLENSDGADTKSGSETNEQSVQQWLLHSLSDNGHAKDCSKLRTGLFPWFESSLEDDLSLGAEAENLMGASGNLAQDVHRVFGQSGSLTSLQAGRPSVLPWLNSSLESSNFGNTIFSIADLLQLHREDPEEVLYNLGFGHHEPHIGEKVPARFFTGHSSAQGIDFRLFLECQMKRLNYENSSLAHRFRQVEVLVNVADAFSSLYSRVSGTPIQCIGKVTTTANCDEPRLECSSSEQKTKRLASRLLQHTRSRHSSQSLCESPNFNTPHLKSSEAVSLVPIEEDFINLNCSTSLQTDLASHPTPYDQCEETNPGNEDLHRLPLPADSPVFYPDTLSETSLLKAHTGAANYLCGGTCCGDFQYENLSEEDSPTYGPGVVTENLHFRKPLTSTPDGQEKDCPGSRLLLLNTDHQQKDSFDIEEIQSDDGAAGVKRFLGPNCRRALNSDMLLRANSGQSDSSGFVEDTNIDNHPIGNNLVTPVVNARRSTDSAESEMTLILTPAAAISSCISDQEQSLKTSQTAAEDNQKMFSEENIFIARGADASTKQAPHEKGSGRYPEHDCAASSFCLGKESLEVALHCDLGDTFSKEHYPTSTKCDGIELTACSHEALTCDKMMFNVEHFAIEQSCNLNDSEHNMMKLKHNSKEEPPSLSPWNAVYDDGSQISCFDLPKTPDRDQNKMVSMSAHLSESTHCKHLAHSFSSSVQQNPRSALPTCTLPNVSRWKENTNLPVSGGSDKYNSNHVHKQDLFGPQSIVSQISVEMSPVHRPKCSPVKFIYRYSTEEDFQETTASGHSETNVALVEERAAKEELLQGPHDEMTAFCAEDQHRNYKGLSRYHASHLFVSVNKMSRSAPCDTSCSIKSESISPSISSALHCSCCKRGLQRFALSSEAAEPCRHTECNSKGSFCCCAVNLTSSLPESGSQKMSQDECFGERPQPQLSPQQLHLLLLDIKVAVQGIATSATQLDLPGDELHNLVTQVTEQYVQLAETELRLPYWASSPRRLLTIREIGECTRLRALRYSIRRELLEIESLLEERGQEMEIQIAPFHCSRSSPALQREHSRYRRARSMSSSLTASHQDRLCPTCSAAPTAASDCGRLMSLNA